jgi:hypothetical protein
MGSLVGVPASMGLAITAFGDFDTSIPFNLDSMDLLQCGRF